MIITKAVKLLMEHEDNSTIWQEFKYLTSLVGSDNPVKLVRAFWQRKIELLDLKPIECPSLPFVQHAHKWVYVHTESEKRFGLRNLVHVQQQSNGKYLWVTDGHVLNRMKTLLPESNYILMGENLYQYNNVHYDTIVPNPSVMRYEGKISDFPLIKADVPYYDINGVKINAKHVHSAHWYAYTQGPTKMAVLSKSVGIGADKYSLVMPIAT